MADDTKDKMKGLLKLIKPATARKTANTKKKEEPQSITVTGSNGVAIGNNNTVHNITTEKVVNKTSISVVPGYEVISEEQKVIIRNLVKEVGDLEKLHKKKPVSYQSIQSAANTKGGATSYHRIQLDKFDVVVKFLRQWIGRLTSAKSAPKKDNAAWRNRQYAFIKINVKQLGSESKLTELLERKFSVESITDLDDTQLRSVYLSVASWKQTAKSKT